MKFTLKENLTEYFRIILYDTDTEEYVSLFRGLGEYLQELYNADDLIYDDFNYTLAQLEYPLEVPNLDFENTHYNFAFTKKAFEIYKNEFDELYWYIDEYSPFKVKINTVKLENKDIIYQDDLQVAWKI